MFCTIFWVGKKVQVLGDEKAPTIFWVDFFFGSFMLKRNLESGIVKTAGKPKDEDGRCRTLLTSQMWNHEHHIQKNIV